MPPLAELAASVQLPQKVWEALDFLYDEQQQRNWISSYLMQCAQRRRNMILFTLKEAGY